MIIKFQISAILFAILVQISTSQNADIWLSFPACKMGRLQSPIKLNVTNSVYNSTYAIVYQNYRNINLKPLNLIAPVVQTNGTGGGFINFQKSGVIKQYQLVRFEIYRGSHQVELDISDWELHIVHKKVLGFTSSQNRYRTIEDANNYLVIVLRYSVDGATNSDNGLIEALLTLTTLTTPTPPTTSNFDLTTYPVFQDKSSYYYEGSFMFNPCDEDVNYIVIEAPYLLTSENNTKIENFYNNTDYGKKELAYAYERPIYRNFMNYTESLDSFSLIFIPYMMIIFLFMQL